MVAPDRARVHARRDPFRGVSEGARDRAKHPHRSAGEAHELGILERFPLEGRANAEGYRLTEKGEELYPVLVSLMQWGDRWLGQRPKATDRAGRRRRDGSSGRRDRRARQRSVVHSRITRCATRPVLERRRRRRLSSRTEMHGLSARREPEGKITPTLPDLQEITHAGASAASYTGSVIENVAPRSGLFAAQILPPWRSTMVRQIEAPSPGRPACW